VSPFWRHLLIATIVILVSWAVAKFVDWRISRHQLDPSAKTRYDVLRKAIFTTIVFVGIVSALLVIPDVRALAGGVLASSAVIGLVIGFASQSTISNVVAGILIAVTQPLRLGDEVEVEGSRGIVEEIGLTYTWIRTADGERLVVPNQRIASESIKNATIRRQESLVEVTIQVPATADLSAVESSLNGIAEEVYVTDLSADKATLVVRRHVPFGRERLHAESDLRVAAADQLKQDGVIGS
jgi:small-conductance mechanosensitive channel